MGKNLKQTLITLAAMAGVVAIVGGIFHLIGKVFE